MTANMARPDRRIQFDVLPERLDELDRLMALCDIRTRKELFDNAMTLFEWAVEVVRNGKNVAEYNKSSDHVEIVRLPVLENAARRAKTHAQLRMVRNPEAVEEPTQPVNRKSHFKVATP